MEYADVTGKKIDPCYSVSSYGSKRGNPTEYKIQIRGSKRWYRVFYYGMTHKRTYFIKKKGEFLIVKKL